MCGEYKLTNLHSKAGTFKAADNQGMAVKGKYTLIEPSNVRFIIFRQDSPPEIVNGTFSLQGDVLTFTSPDRKEFVEMTKDRLGYRAEARKVVKSGEDYKLREQQTSYIANSDPKKVTLSNDNNYLWNVFTLNQDR